MWSYRLDSVGIRLAFYPAMDACSQEIRKTNYRGREVKESYQSATKEFIIKNPRRNAT